MKLIILVTFVLVAASFPAAAQDFGGYYPVQDEFMRDIYDPLKEVESEPSREARSTSPRGRSAFDWSGFVATPTIKIDHAAFDFEVDSSVRERAVSSFLDALSEADPENARQLRSLPTENFFTPYDTVLPRFGLEPTNLADTLTVYIVQAWGTANRQEETVPTKAQIAGVRDQAEATLESRVGRNDTQLQYESDQFLLNTLAMDAMIRNAAAGKADVTADQFAERIGAMTREQFGVDFRTLALTDEGLVPR